MNKFIDSFKRMTYKENVIIPNEFLKNVLKELYKHYNYIEELLEDEEIEILVSYLNRILKPFFIEFSSMVLRDEILFIQGMMDDLDDAKLKIVLNRNIPKIDKNIEEFFSKLRIYLGHEVIHRYQFIKQNTIELKTKSSFNRREYLSNKHEIMSHAWEIVFTYKLYGNTSQDIKKLLQSNSPLRFVNNIVLATYFEEFKTIDDPVIKLLYKYIYMYL